MSETGWPLIPREVLPAPVPAVKTTVRRPVPHGDLGRQLSIFGAETTESSPADLAGLLAGPGRLDRMGGTARISVRVDAAWRVHVLVAELVSRGLVVSWMPVAATGAEEGGPRELSREPFEIAEAPDSGDGERPADETGADGQRDRKAVTRDTPTEALHTTEDAKDAENAKSAKSDEPGNAATTPADQDPDPGPGPGDAPDGLRPDDASFEVRTAYSSRLNGLARSWPATAHQLFLSGPRLRLWVAAAGAPWPGGYALGLDPESADPGKNHEIVDAALVRAGLAGRVSDDGRYWLILGRKRLRRLAELVGDRPPAAPEAAWPGGAAA
jgi:hypothetical protein